MAINGYNQWFTTTKEEESKAAKQVAYMANFLKTCYGIDTATRDPDADIRTTPIDKWYIDAVDQNADQLDCLYGELDSMIDDIKRAMEHIAELSDIRRELATTTEEDFED